MISMKPCKVALDWLRVRKSVEIELCLSGGVEGTPALGELCVGVDVARLYASSMLVTG